MFLHLTATTGVVVVSIVVALPIVAFPEYEPLTPTGDLAVYRRRNTVERGFNLYKHYRGLAFRCDKTAVNYLGGLAWPAPSCGPAHDHPGDTG